MQKSARGWIYIHLDDFVSFLFVIGFILVVIAIPVVFVALATAKSNCLELGYPGSTIDWKLTQYCVKRVDQTDVVVPLSKLKVEGK